MNFPRVEVLGNYSMRPPKEDYEAIISLVNWCNNQYLLLSKYSSSIKKVSEYTTIGERSLPPKCMIKPDVLEQQPKKVNEFRAIHEHIHINGQ